jgi:hypothetical protein
MEFFLCTPNNKECNEQARNGTQMKRYKATGVAALIFRYGQKLKPVGRNVLGL